MSENLWLFSVLLEKLDVLATTCFACIQCRKNQLLSKSSLFHSYVVNTCHIFFHTVGLTENRSAQNSSVLSSFSPFKHAIWGYPLLWIVSWWSVPQLPWWILISFQRLWKTISWTFCPKPVGSCSVLGSWGCLGLEMAGDLAPIQAKNHWSTDSQQDLGIYTYIYIIIYIEIIWYNAN